MKIVLFGYGKMGKAIEQAALAPGHEIVLKIGREDHPTTDLLRASGADVVIEFTRPEAAYDNLRLCLEAGLPVVSGTTGWLERKAELEAFCHEKNGAFFYAANFSVGVNLFFALNRYLAGLMGRFPQYRPKLEETHHLEKKDAPSGTAIRLAEELIGQFPALQKWVKGEEAAAGELPVISHREGRVPGTHTILWRSEEDEIELTHRAFSREGFARGALRAAEWLQGKKGCFGMDDLLGL